jgi:hypothetical protein
MTLIMLGFAAVGSQAPAQAAETAAAASAAAEPAHSALPWFCPENQFCLYAGINYSGSNQNFRPNANVPNLSGYQFNNIASSMVNKTGRTVILYLDSNYRNPVYYAAPYSEDSSFLNNSCNNNVSSLSFR